MNLKDKIVLSNDVDIININGFILRIDIVKG